MRFGELHIRSHTRPYIISHVSLYVRSHDPRSRDHGVTNAFIFGISFDKQVIVKSYLPLNKKSLYPIGEQEENQCFY